MLQSYEHHLPYVLIHVTQFVSSHWKVVSTQDDLVKMLNELVVLLLYELEYFVSLDLENLDDLFALSFVRNVYEFYLFHQYKFVILQHMLNLILLIVDILKCTQQLEIGKLAFLIHRPLSNIPFLFS